LFSWNCWIRILLQLRRSGRLKEDQAVALRSGGDKAAFYNCRLIGFQDTLCDDKGRHFFKNCYIEGTVDFISGSGKSLYLVTSKINSYKHLNSWTFKAGVKFINAGNEEKGASRPRISRDNCASKTQGRWYWIFFCALQSKRNWERPPVMFAYTEMSSVVDPVGWSDNLHPERDR